MPVRSAHAVWNGKLKDGKGKMKFGGGAFEGNYSFSSRFENGEGTNPEELIAAAHAGCFSMALSAALEKEGFDPNSVSTNAEVDLQKTDNGFAIKTITLKNESDVPGITEEVFLKIAEDAKSNCPVSKALAGTEIKLDAQLKS